MTDFPPDKVILLFPSIHYVLRAEKALKAAGLTFDLIPVPREINSDCGMAVEIDIEKIQSVEKTLSEAKIHPEAMFVRQKHFYQPLKSV